MPVHPEVVSNQIEPTIGEELRYVEFCRGLDRATPDEVLEMAKLLAKQCLVSQPAVIRFLAREAAHNLTANGLTKDWSNEVEAIRDTLKAGEIVDEISD
tara:strand:+ start:8692 stop:8988 length:297 start_codon:yes stop_codon:yes gene_type:complete